MSELKFCKCPVLDEIFLGIAGTPAYPYSFIVLRLGWLCNVLPAVYAPSGTRLTFSLHWGRGL